ncbi:hypothetical protein [Clostridium intestinale]|uniref:hypothetical protein n=1 Tax=Clostridium intestinale TaxID=36845 RepID=UPI002DD69003|nr:hypothetical protein [Clostridium intestinale]WRY53946.1 hypothetical protein P8F83_12205 [Clostridium intestinale]
MSEKKSVTYKNLKIGQEIKGHKLENLSSSYSAIVKAINPAYVTILKWGKIEEKIDSRSLFDIEMTQQEFKDKYKETAKEILKNIKNKLHLDEIGYHEGWNTWLYGTPYEMAQYCIKDKIKIVGYCKDIIPKIAMFSGDTLDIGVCAEYEDGERFWCHYRYQDIERLFKRYRELVEE